MLFNVSLCILALHLYKLHSSSPSDSLIVAMLLRRHQRQLQAYRHISTQLFFHVFSRLSALAYRFTVQAALRQSVISLVSKFK